MKNKIFIFLIFGIIFYSNSQDFEGTISISIIPDSTDIATKKEMIKVNRIRETNQFQSSINNPKLIEYIEKNPEEKENIESLLLVMATQGNIITLVPKSFLISVKGYNSLHKIKGGANGGLEILSLKEKNISYQIKHSDNTYKERLKKSPKHNIEVTKTIETERILGFECSKYIFKITQDGRIRESEIWIAPPTMGLDIDQIIQYPTNGDLSNSYLKRIDGIPLRAKMTIGTGKFIMEIKNINQKKLPSSLFNIPNGYEKVD